MNFKIGDTLDYESVIGLGVCSGRVVGVSNTGDGEESPQPLYATVRNQKGHDITVHWTRVVKVHPSSRTLGVQTEGSHSDLQSEVERLYIGWSKEIALAAEAKIEYEKVLAEKDSEIERLKRDLVDAVQNIQAHSMIVDSSEKDAKIERLTEVLKDLISKLDSIASDSQFQGIFVLNQMHGGKYTGPTWAEELERAREATR